MQSEAVYLKKKRPKKIHEFKSNSNVFLMLKFTMEVAAASENILILLSKQHFSLLFAYQRVTSLESKYSLVVTRVQGLITQHLIFSLCIPVGPFI